MPEGGVPGRESRILCPVCLRRFETEDRLVDHFRTLHQDAERVPAFLMKAVRSMGQPAGGRARGIAECQDWLCHYCRVRMTVEPGPRRVTIDHVRSRMQGGRDDAPNRVAACFTCNQLKGGYIDADAFLKLMRGEAVTAAEIWPAFFRRDG